MPVMKRCPECLFIYPESDSRCDFDNTPLVVVDDAELEAATGPSPAPAKPKSKRAPRKRPRKVVTFIAALIVAVVAFVVYLGIAQRRAANAELQASVTAKSDVVPAPVELPPPVESSAPVEMASPSPSPSVVPKVGSERMDTSHSRATAAPVSTSGPGLGKKLGGKPVILLTSGGKIDADEVWRTRDGVWYRRAGIVTLLKPGRVKAIVNH